MISLVYFYDPYSNVNYIVYELLVSPTNDYIKLGIQNSLYRTKVKLGGNKLLLLGTRKHLHFLADFVVIQQINHCYIFTSKK